MSARGPLWYWLHDPTDEIAETERRLDRLDAEIDLLHRMQFQETKQKLERAGYDVSNYRPAPARHPSEIRSRNSSS